MNEYELLYILSPRVPADEVANAIERVSVLVGNAGGEVTAVDNWGRRRLAYPIRQYFEGTYVVLTLQLPPSGAAGLEASLVIADEVIRHLLTSGVIPRTPGGRSRSSEEYERGESSGSDSSSASRAMDDAAPAAMAAAPAAESAAPASMDDVEPAEVMGDGAVTSDEAPKPETQPVAAAAE